MGTDKLAVVGVKAHSLSEHTQFRYYSAQRRTALYQAMALKVERAWYAALSTSQRAAVDQLDPFERPPVDPSDAAPVALPPWSGSARVVSAVK